MHPTQSLTVTQNCSIPLSCSCKRSAPALLGLRGIASCHCMTLLHTAYKHAFTIKHESSGCFEARRPKHYKGGHHASKPQVRGWPTLSSLAMSMKLCHASGSGFHPFSPYLLLAASIIACSCLIACMVAMLFFSTMMTVIC